METSENSFTYKSQIVFFFFVCVFSSTFSVTRVIYTESRGQRVNSNSC